MSAVTLADNMKCGWAKLHCGANTKVDSSGWGG